MTDLIITPSVISSELVTAQGQEYGLRISQTAEDAAWDAFLAETPGGHHVQTSLWAQVKAIMGWQPVRLIIMQDGQIVAGAQVLLRSLPLVGTVGFVAKGPLLTTDDPVLVDLVVTELQRLARKHRIQHLTIQPSITGKNMAQALLAKGFRPSSVEVAPKATLLLDLTPHIETIMAGMSRKTRYNIRLSGRDGVTVREGSAQDLDTYYQILTATGQRQDFSPYPKRYFTEMWQVLRPHGFAQLFIAEYEGEVVAAQFAVPFGDTVINKMSVWNGRHGKHRPNEALQWAAIQWAKAQGYRYYDFEGIKPSAARAMINEETLPDSLKQTVTSFKLGFGGQVVLFSEAYNYLYNPLFRWVYNEVFPRCRNWRLVRRLLKQVRTN